MKLTKQAVRRIALVVAITPAAIAGGVLYGLSGCLVATALAVYCRYFRMPELECEQNFPSEGQRFSTLAVLLFLALFLAVTVVGTGGHAFGFSASTIALGDKLAKLMLIGFASSVFAMMVGDVSTKRIW